jgi:uncharacterized membrane protein
MSSKPVLPSAGRALSPGAIALMLMLCLSWGFNQIAVKLVLPDVPPMLQALIRSVGALPVLLAIGWFRGVKFFERDGTLWSGVSAGVIFGIEFVLIYRGLQLTSASRAVVFLYTAPFFVALGSYVFLGERLRASQWGGLGLSFAGVALAIGVPQANVDASVLMNVKADEYVAGARSVGEGVNPRRVRAQRLRHAFSDIRPLLRLPQRPDHSRRRGHLDRRQLADQHDGQCRPRSVLDGWRAARNDRSPDRLRADPGRVLDLPHADDAVRSEAGRRTGQRLRAPAARSPKAERPAGRRGGVVHGVSSDHRRELREA